MRESAKADMHGMRLDRTAHVSKMMCRMGQVPLMAYLSACGFLSQRARDASTGAQTKTPILGSRETPSRVQVSGKTLSNGSKFAPMRHNEASRAAERIPERIAKWPCRARPSTAELGLEGAATTQPD